MVPLKLHIEESFYRQEDRDGFVVSAEMKKVWAVELDLLNEFARICTEHNLKWFVHAGTMLGAVRHHGFIPWDDDIDVIMPRRDYEKLCSIGSECFVFPYFFQNDSTDPFFCRNFSRLRNSETTAIIAFEKDFCFPYNQGAFIDIFPLDNLADNEDIMLGDLKKMKRLSDTAWQYRNMVHFYHPKKGKGIIKRIKYFVKHIWYKYFDTAKGDYKRVLKAHHELMTIHNGTKTKRVGELVVNPIGRHIWDREWLREAIWMPFEMLLVPVPINYSECLASSYGTDWNTPKQQATYHGQMLFDMDHSYHDYLIKKRNV